MSNKNIITGIIAVAVTALTLAVAVRMLQDKTVKLPPVSRQKPAANRNPVKRQPKPKPETKRDTATAVKQQADITGTLRDTDGNPVAGVTVSNGIECVLTDSLGRYILKNDSTARFVFYSVPADCEVPTHSQTDRTACFYLPVAKGRQRYDFTLRRLPGGAEKNYRMIVIGDPQVTNAFNPCYNTPDDNDIEVSDVERFATETMVDIRRTIRSLPAGTPVYGLSMGDDVQYYGGYNPTLERQIREALGSSEMRLFSVIGNHDQDGNPEYLRKWEENWGPTDYSFNRGNEHYVCFNNVQFHQRGGYYSPGELTDRQMEWLRQDLALTPRSKKVILCYHIPLTFGTSPRRGALPVGNTGEEGHFVSVRLSPILSMLRTFSGYELFCGHTHFAVNHEITHAGQHVMEHCHAAACGNIWQSNVNICGTPNGYYVYSFSGGRLAGCYYKGTFWDARRQMTLFRADTDFNGETYAADWNLPAGRGVVVANVFNADSRWRVTAEEDGVEYPMTRICAKGQDAFATGYHHKYEVATNFRFISKQNAYLIMNHLYWYEPKSPDSDIRIIARDPYGHVFWESLEEVVTEPFFNFAHYYEQ